MNNHEKTTKRKYTLKFILEKISCGLSFQYLPESIYMIQKYEVIRKKCTEDFVKKLKSHYKK